jgi:hypothetical protein
MVMVGAGIGAAGVSAGPLAATVNPQQALDFGSERGPSQWAAQQAMARSSAAATPGFTYAD